MRSGLVASLALAPALFVALPAAAEEDSFGVGTGADGALTVTSPTVVNDYVTLVADAGGSVLLTSDTGGKFGAGDLVMIYTSTGKTPVPTTLPDIQTAVTFAGFGVQIGHYEFARIASATSTSLTLTKPVETGFSAIVTQIVRVPEFTDVTISGAGVIHAAPWNGATGGVAAFLANGTVQIGGGGVDVSSAGFRGGVAAAGQTALGDSASLDADPSATLINAMKGEGFGLTTYGATFVGRGNRFGGGGGGDSFHAGGGGGSNGGKGGAGGNSTTGGAVGGFGGVSHEYDLRFQLIFGGGGGAGHATNDATLSSGASGGGAAIVRAKTVQIDSGIRANGGVPSKTTAAGAGGGGAGGNVVLRVTGAISCGPGGVIQARGGLGGSVGALDGPGGGGSGGRVLVQASTLAPTCVPDTDGAYNGVTVGGLPSGASAGSGGASMKILAAFCGVDADCPQGELCDFAADACSSSTDLDGDGVPNASDDCVHVPNPDQADADMDGVGDACEPPPDDSDHDGVPDATDNCPFAPNTDQADADADGHGDACDPPDPAMECASDDACGDATSGSICVDAKCVMGCRGKGGNGCPADRICSSVDAHPGTCSASEGTSSSSGGGYDDPNGIFIEGKGVACALSAGSSSALFAPILALIAAFARHIRRARRPEVARGESRPTFRRL
ncbi:MAG: thrombospondin type 3 repeat-containing protein [Polyangiaceae bacterium]